MTLRKILKLTIFAILVFLQQKTECLTFTQNIREWFKKTIKNPKLKRNAMLRAGAPFVVVTAIGVKMLFDNSSKKKPTKAAICLTSTWKKLSENNPNFSIDDFNNLSDEDRLLKDESGVVIFEIKKQQSNHNLKNNKVSLFPTKDNTQDLSLFLVWEETNPYSPGTTINCFLIEVDKQKGVVTKSKPCCFLVKKAQENNAENLAQKTPAPVPVTHLKQVVFSQPKRTRFAVRKYLNQNIVKLEVPQDQDENNGATAQPSVDDGSSNTTSNPTTLKSLETVVSINPHLRALKHLVNATMVPEVVVASPSPETPNPLPKDQETDSRTSTPVCLQAPTTPRQNISGSPEFSFLSPSYDTQESPARSTADETNKIPPSPEPKESNTSQATPKKKRRKRKKKPAETQPAPAETQPAPAETQPAPAETQPAPAKTQPDVMKKKLNAPHWSPVKRNAHGETIYVYRVGATPHTPPRQIR